MQAEQEARHPDPPRQHARRHRRDGGLPRLARRAQHHRASRSMSMAAWSRAEAAPRMDRLRPPAVCCGCDYGRLAMPLTQDLGRFASGLTFEKLPREAVEIARTGFIDTIATMIAGAHDPAPQLLRRGLAPAPATGQPVFLGRDRRRAGSGVDQRHRRPRARLRRCRLPRPCLDRAGAGDPRRGRDAGPWRARDVRGLCRGLRDLGRAGAPRPRPPPRQGLAPDRHFRRDRGRRRLRRIAPPRRRARRRWRSRCRRRRPAASWPISAR